MRLLRQDVLARAVRRHGDTRQWLHAWAATVEDAAWQSLNDVRVDYPSSDGVKLESDVVVTVFNVRGNDYRLLTNINYAAQLVLVLGLLTHAQYDKQQWKKRTEMPSTARPIVPDSYMKLITEFPLRRIKTAAEHAQATKLVLRLSTRKPDRGAAEYLDVLIDLMADYEQRSGQTVDDHALSAADLVRHRIEQRGMSVSAVAKQIGIPQSNLSEMLSGKRDWSKTAIRGLSRMLHIRADRFLA